MNHVKKFNESWKDIFGKDDFYKESENYLNQFKKHRNEMTKSENLLVNFLYELEFKDSHSLRYLGAAEAILIILGYIESGEEFDYKDREGKIFYMKFKTKENYRDYIIRKIKEYFKENGIM